MTCAVDLKRVDQTLGEGLERAVRAHHRRRLRRLGWHAALDPPVGWASGEPAAAAGQRARGPRRRRRGAAGDRGASSRRRARTCTSRAGSSRRSFARSRTARRRCASCWPSSAERVDVRVLAWAGAPLPLFHPDRSRGRASAAMRSSRGTRIRCRARRPRAPAALPSREARDRRRRVAFVGGIDLTSLAGDRLDAPRHPARGALGWHDAASRLRGPGRRRRRRALPRCAGTR